MRLVITGGTGFVGRAAVAEALRVGAEVVLLTRDSAASAPPGVEILGLGHARWTEEALSSALRRIRPEAILHLAGGPGQEPLEGLYEANVFLGSRLLDAAREIVPDARVVVVGSAAEYGPPLGADGRSREDDPARPITAYGIAKLAQTLHALVAARAGQSVVAARLFNPVGPGMPRSLAFADFAAQIAGGGGHLVTGDIDTERDFIPVAEAARILLDLAVSDGAVGRIINVCSGRAQPVRWGVEHMLARSRRNIELVVRGGHPAGVRTIFGDTAGLRALGIAPGSSDIGPALDGLLHVDGARLA